MDQCLFVCRIFQNFDNNKNNQLGYGQMTILENFKISKCIDVINIF